MLESYKIVLKKELIDIFRDKRSFAMLFVPIFLFPLMYFLMGTQLDKSDEIPCIVKFTETSDEALYNSIFSESTRVKYNIDDNKKVTINNVSVVEDADTDLMKGEVSCVIEVKSGEIIVKYNGNSQKSGNAAAKIKEYLEAVSSGLIGASLNNFGLSVMDLDSLNLCFEDVNEESGSDGANAFMASIAPMMLVIVIMSSGISIAIDLFSGEKEKGTFESLLTTQVDRKSLFFAKFTAIFVIGMTSMILSITAYIVSFALNPDALGLYTGVKEADTSQLAVSVQQVLQVLTVCFSLSIFAVSIMSFIGLRAKTVKEAQSQMSIITIIPSLLSGLTMFMESADVNNTAMFIPVFNTILSIKMIFLGTVEPVQIAISSLSCIAYSLIISTVCVKMLNSEKLM